jgi:hypothetical protein
MKYHVAVSDRFGRTWLIIAAVSTITIGCGKSDPKPVPNPATPASGPQTEAAKHVSEGARQIAEGTKQVARGVQSWAEAAVKPVDFEALEAQLPEIGGWKKENAAGELLSLPTPYSTAHARYTNDASTVDLEITDSAMSQVLLPISMFLATGFEERSDDGHTKSLTLHGSPGYENWNKTGHTADVTVVVANRFVVRGRGREVASSDPVKTIVQAVNFGQLSKLK